MKNNKNNQNPIINWEELEKIAFRGMFPPPPMVKKDGKTKAFQHGPGTGIGGWDNTADYYNRMVQMEVNYTLKQLDCFDTDPSDTVLDVCCGTGRIAVPMAKRAKSVTALDASPKMLKHLDTYAKKENVSNISTLLMDWDEKADVKKIDQHDIVIASRSQALRDIQLLSDIARKYVVMIIWANGGKPIPMIIGSLFKGTTDDEQKRPAFPMPDRRIGNNILYNKVYDLGYDPNVRIVDDGWERTFKDRDEAYNELLKLASPQMTGEITKMDVFKANADQYLTENPDGTIDFFAATKSMVIWWSVDKER